MVQPHCDLCEDCKEKCKNFGFESEGKRRWCATCAKKYPGAVCRPRQAAARRAKKLGAPVLKHVSAPVPAYLQPGSAEYAPPAVQKRPRSQKRQLVPSPVPPPPPPPPPPLGMDGMPPWMQGSTKAAPKVHNRKPKASHVATANRGNQNTTGTVPTAAPPPGSISSAVPSCVVGEGEQSYTGNIPGNTQQAVPPARKSGPKVCNECGFVCHPHLSCNTCLRRLAKSAAATDFYNGASYLLLRSEIERAALDRSAGRSTAAAALSG